MGLKIKYMSVLLAVGFLCRIGQTAVISGFVTDAKTNEPLVSVNVVLEETSLGASTDINGKYIITNLEPGVYTLRSSCIGYKNFVYDDIIVNLDDELEFNIEMTGSVVLLEDAKVVGIAKKGSIERELTDRFQSASITDALSGEQMKRLPDPDIAAVVRRTTGVSTVGGDPIIRGLGLRYSKVTLNNSQVSGTKPNQSGVSLDLFPSSMMSKVTVNKSFLPDQNGEFGGGVVDMNTWEFLKQKEFKISGSLGYNILLGRQSFMDYRGGKYDFLGFDDGTRQMPDEIRQIEKLYEDSRFDTTGFSPEEMERYAEMFSNIWSGERKDPLPTGDLAMSYANSTQMFGKKFEYLLSALYKNASAYEENERRIYKSVSEGVMGLMHNYTFYKYDQAIELGGLSAFKLELSPFTKLNLNILLNRDFQDELRRFEGTNRDRDKDVIDTRLRMVAQTISTYQLSGQHLLYNLGNTITQWRVTYSHGYREEPDTREVQYEKARDDSVYVFADENQSGSHFFSELNDDSWNYDIDFTYPLTDRIKLKSGALVLEKHREFNSRKFQFGRDTRDMTAANFDFTQTPEELFNPDNIHKDAFFLWESTRPTDWYNADQSLWGAFLMTDYQITSKLRFIGGVRLEKSEVTLKTGHISQPDVDSTTSYKSEDLMPAMNLIYSFDENRNLRFAASQTVSRPDYRELSPFEFTDIIGGHSVKGNPYLKRAIIQNFDLRYELKYGYSKVNLVAVSVFFKNFINPIETIVEGTAQNRQTWQNASGAENYGVELELRQRLGDIHPGLSYWGISTNLTLLQSDIIIDTSDTKGVQTLDRRPLHGQSPYLFNFGINFQHPTTKTQADILYHVFGKRIDEVGANTLPDVYELPHPDLDFVIQQPISKKLKTKFAWKNILDPEVKFQQGDDYTQKYRLGSTFSIGLTYIN
ncbi:TonB-dependent receptor [bacterium]|nr:TonB-dependent receptor [bacterium]